jgi:hypothetical protein
MLQPTPEEAKHGGGPILPRFVRANQAAKPAEPVPPAPEDEPRAAVIDKDGTEYLEAD